MTFEDNFRARIIIGRFLSLAYDEFLLFLPSKLGQTATASCFRTIPTRYQINSEDLFMTLTIDHDQLTMTTIMIMSFEKHDHDNDQHEQREVHTIESEVEEPVCKRSREEPRPPRGSISSTGNIFNDNHCNEKDDYEDVFKKGNIPVQYLPLLQSQGHKRNIYGQDLRQTS